MHDDQWPAAGVVALSDLIDLGAEPRVNLRSARFVDAGEVQQNDLIGKISRSIDAVVAAAKRSDR
jgi:hypothetical protein